VSPRRDLIFAFEIEMMKVLGMKKLAHVKRRGLVVKVQGCPRREGALHPLMEQVGA